MGGMILGAALNKTPILINIFQTKSTVGLSLGSCYGEVLLYSNAAFYGIIRNIPFTAWGENGIMTIQSILICILYWKLSTTSTISLQHKAMSILLYMFYIIIVFYLLPFQYAYILQVLNWPVLIYARCTQIHYTYTVKHTGTQSVITTLMNFLGNAIRIGTTLKEVGLDIAFLSGYVSSLLLWFITLVQFYLYNDNTTKFLHDLKEKKKD